MLLHSLSTLTNTPLYSLPLIYPFMLTHQWHQSCHARHWLADWEQSEFSIPLKATLTPVTAGAGDRTANPAISGWCAAEAEPKRTAQMSRSPATSSSCSQGNLRHSQTRLDTVYCIIPPVCFGSSPGLLPVGSRKPPKGDRQEASYSHAQTPSTASFHSRGALVCLQAPFRCPAI